MSRRRGRGFIRAHGVPGTVRMFDSVAFFSSEDKISELELSIANRYIERNPLFVVCGNRRKGEDLARYLGAFRSGSPSVANMERVDSERLVPYIAKQSSFAFEADITLAPPYYAASIALVCVGSGGRMVFTRPDGSLLSVDMSGADYGSLDSDDLSILEEVFYGNSTSKGISEVTGINYKTLSRRLTKLTDHCLLRSEGGRPKRYSMTPEQKTMFLSRTGDDGSIDLISCNIKVTASNVMPGNADDLDLILDHGYMLIDPCDEGE